MSVRDSVRATGRVRDDLGQQTEIVRDLARYGLAVTVRRVSALRDRNRDTDTANDSRRRYLVGLGAPAEPRRGIAVGDDQIVRTAEIRAIGATAVVTAIHVGKDLMLRHGCRRLTGSSVRTGNDRAHVGSLAHDRAEGRCIERLGTSGGTKTHGHQHDYCHYCKPHPGRTTLLYASHFMRSLARCSLNWGLRVLYHVAEYPASRCATSAIAHEVGG